MTAGWIFYCLFVLFWSWFLDVRWAFKNNKEHQSHFLGVYIALAEGKMASHDS